MRRMGCASVSSVSVLALALLVSMGGRDGAWSQSLSPDVGLVTHVAGEVTYWNDTYQKTPERPQLYMKIRPGDRFKVPQGGMLQLVYFQNSRQETWKGPSALAVRDQEGLPEGGARPEVTTLPAGASQGMRRLPPLLNRAGLSRSGGIQVRGISPGSARGPVLTAEAEAEIRAARETYAGWRKQAGPDDVTPELYLAGILGEYGQYEEMRAVLRDAAQRQPDSDLVRDLSAWASAQR